MSLFKVKGATMDGKILHREVEGSTKDALSMQLEREGLFPVEIRGKRGIFSLLKIKGRVKSQDLIAFNQGFITLIRAGIPILEAFETLMKGSRAPEARLPGRPGSRCREALQREVRREPTIEADRWACRLATIGSDKASRLEKEKNSCMLKAFDVKEIDQCDKGYAGCTAPCYNIPQMIPAEQTK